MNERQSRMPTRTVLAGVSITSAPRETNARLGNLRRSMLIESNPTPTKNVVEAHSITRPPHHCPTSGTIGGNISPHPRITANATAKPFFEDRDAQVGSSRTSQKVSCFSAYSKTDGAWLATRDSA